MNKKMGEPEEISSLIECAKDLFSLRGKVAVVTGGAGWLGLPISIALASFGARVVIASRPSPRFHAICQNLSNNGVDVVGYSCDVTNDVAVSGLIQFIEADYGSLDIVVNNASAGNSYPAGFDAPAEAFMDAANGNLSSAWRLIKNALPLLREAQKVRGDASIINIASMYGKVSPYPDVYKKTAQTANPVFYGAAKAGLIQITKWLAATLGPEGIRVNSISPGPFPQWNARETSPEFVELLDSKTVIGRVGRRDEIMSAIVFLASSKSSFITGADISVDGGWTTW